MIASLILMTVMFVPQGEPYVLVLTNNKQMRVAQPPDCGDKTCKVMLLNGEFTSFPARLIDHDKTAAYNQELARVREEEAFKKAEEEKAAAELAAAEAEKEAVKEIKLRRYEKLPETDDSQNAITGSIGSDEAQPTGSARVRNFTSQDLIYISWESITPYENEYVIECDVRTNEQEGSVENVQVLLKVIFDEGVPRESTQTVAAMTSGEPARVVFRVPKSGELVRTNYSIDYDVIIQE